MYQYNYGHCLNSQFSNQNNASMPDMVHNCGIVKASSHCYHFDRKINIDNVCMSTIDTTKPQCVARQARNSSMEHKYEISTRSHAQIRGSFHNYKLAYSILFN
jgi:hypothetical protein